MNVCPIAHDITPGFPPSLLAPPSPTAVRTRDLVIDLGFEALLVGSTPLGRDLGEDLGGKASTLQDGADLPPSGVQVGVFRREGDLDDLDGPGRPGDDLPVRLHTQGGDPAALSRQLQGRHLAASLLDRGLDHAVLERPVLGLRVGGEDLDRGEQIRPAV